MNQNIEVQERLQTQSLNNLPESLQRFLITARGKYMWLEPHCKHCNSPNVVHNGYYICESFIIKALNLDIKHGHYLCKDCNLTFSTPFPELQSFLQDLQTFLAETCFHLFTNGMTFDGIAQYITEQYKIALSDETARRYYKDCAQSYREEKSLVSSGYFSVDCQHLKVNGNHAVRLSVIDIVNKKCLVDIIIEAEANEEIIDRLRLHLLPYDVRGMVVDGKGGLLRALKKEFSVPVQRCIMHVQKLIVQDYIKKYGKNLSLLQLRNMYMQLNILMNHDVEVQMLNRLLKEKIIEQDEIRPLEEFYTFRKSLRKYRRKQKIYLLPRTEEEMLEKLNVAKMFLTEKHEKRRLEKIEKEWKELTEFLRVPELAPTNNAVEHYYSKTLTKTDKKRFRAITALRDRIAASRAVFNQWFKPTVTLKEILQKYALLFYLFSV